MVSRSLNGRRMACDTDRRQSEQNQDTKNRRGSGPVSTPRRTCDFSGDAQQLLSNLCNSARRAIRCFADYLRFGRGTMLKRWIPALAYVLIAAGHLRVAPTIPSR
jgi:hypothetical protein